MTIVERRGKSHWNQPHHTDSVSVISRAGDHSDMRTGDPEPTEESLFADISKSYPSECKPRISSRKLAIMLPR